MEQTTIELAIHALEAEKAKIDAAIAELKASLNGQRTVRKVSRREMPTPLAASPKTAGQSGKRRMSAAGRKAISLAAKRRWAKARALGKNTL